MKFIMPANFMPTNIVYTVLGYVCMTLKNKTFDIQIFELEIGALDSPKANYDKIVVRSTGRRRGTHLHLVHS